MMHTVKMQCIQIPFITQQLTACLEEVSERYQLQGVTHETGVVTPSPTLGVTVGEIIQVQCWAQ